MAEGMFNFVDPRILQQAYTQQFQVPEAQFAQLPLLQQVASMGTQTGANVGSSLGRLFGGQSAMEAENAMLKDIFSKASELSADPMERLQIAAKGLREKGMEGRALQLEKQASDIAAANALAQQRQREANPVMELAKTGKYTPQSLAVYAQSKNVSDLVFKDSESGINYSTNAEEVARELYGTNFGSLTPSQAAAVNTTVQARKEAAAAKGAANITQTIPQGGPWKPSEVGGAVTNVRATLEPISNSISDASRGLTLLDLNSPKADAQVDRLLATLSGDKQLSIQEVQMVANAGSFGQRVADSVQKFFGGTAGELSRQEKRELLEVLQAAQVASYNRNREQLKRQYGLTDAPKERIEELVGPEKTLPESSMKRLVERSGVPYEPSKYTYRIGPQGQIQRKAKGK